MKRRAAGGEIGRGSSGTPIQISEGLAVVPDAAMRRYDRRLFRRLSGGPVISASEAWSELNAPEN